MADFALDKLMEKSWKLRKLSQVQDKHFQKISA